MTRRFSASAVKREAEEEIGAIRLRRQDPSLQDNGASPIRIRGDEARRIAVNIAELPELLLLAFLEAVDCYNRRPCQAEPATNTRSGIAVDFAITRPGQTQSDGIFLTNMS